MTSQGFRVLLTIRQNHRNLQERAQMFPKEKDPRMNPKPVPEVKENFHLKERVQKTRPKQKPKKLPRSRKSDEVMHKFN